MSSITIATVPTGHSGCDHQIRWPGRPSAPRITGAPCVDATCSADSSMSTAELHERVAHPSGRSATLPSHERHELAAHSRVRVYVPHGVAGHINVISALSLQRQDCEVA